MSDSLASLSNREAAIKLWGWARAKHHAQLQDALPFAQRYVKQHFKDNPHLPKTRLRQILTYLDDFEKE